VSRILVAGLINLETTVRVDGFPIPYTPVRFPFGGVRSTVSGVGYNIARALTVLGDEVRFLALVAPDGPGRMVEEALLADGIAGDGVLPLLAETPQSAIFYDGDGKRQINVDLKSVQEAVYPEARFDEAAAGCDLAVLCNVNWARPLLRRARALGLPVVTDVHAVSDLDDPYNRDFMAAADLLFQSDALLQATPEAWAQAVLDRYGPEIVVVGLGAEGALLGLRRAEYLGRLPAVSTRPIVSTIGAGDALLSAFVHCHARGVESRAALARAVLFASYKLGEASASAGFLDATSLEALYAATAQETGGDARRG
jgi:ribokinase